MVRLEKETLSLMRDPTVLYDFINVLIRLQAAQIESLQTRRMDCDGVWRMVQVNDLSITRYEFKDYWSKKEVNEKVILSISVIMKENHIIIDHFSQEAKKNKKI
jgi:hypothetical protein